MNKMQKMILMLILGITLSVISNPSMAQPGAGNQPGGGIQDSPQGVPFDGGLSIILIAVGAGLGRKKIKTSKVIE